MNQLFNSTIKYCVWLLMCVSCCLPSLGQSQATEEEKAYAMRIYQMQAAEDEAGFYQAEQDFMNYLLERKDWAKYYNVWMNRVVFDINQKHFSRAFTEIRHITEDIRKRGNTEFLYIPNQALGLYYVNRGHHEMGSRYFLKALESVDSVANPLAVANLNLSLAQAFSFFDPDRALSHLDRLPSLYDNPTTESGVLGYRCIINYEKGDLEAFSRSFERYDSLRLAYPEVFNEVNYANVMVYHSLSINDYEAALSWCDSITVPEESAEIRTKVYAAMGDWKNAYKELSSRDSLQLQSLNEVLEEDIEELSHSIDLLESEREKAKLRKTQIIVVSLSALLAILALVLALYYRYKKNRRLRQHYEHLQEALAIRRSFVTSIYQRLQSPVSVLKGYARIFNNPDFRLTMEQREKSYHDIAAAGRSIETLLEPVLDSYIHDNMSISDEQRQLCQDALNSPLQTLISTAEIIAEDENHQMPDSDYMQLRSVIGHEAYQVAIATHELVLFSMYDENQQIALTDELGLNEIALTTMNAYDLRNKQLTLQFDTAVDNEVKITTSQRHLQEVLNCLLNNADKFATGGEVLLRCLQANDGTYSIAVSYQGQPVSAEQAERIFQPFTRFSAEYHGIGLGMALAKRLSTAMGYVLALEVNTKECMQFSISGIK